MARRSGLSVRLRLALSYAAVVVLAGSALLAVVWVFLLRYVPQGELWRVTHDGELTFVPDRDDLVRAFLPPTVAMFVFLVLAGLLGGWLLAGWMLRPLRRLHEAARRAGEGSLSHRVALQGRGDEFRDLSDAFDLMLERLERYVGEQQRFAANASHELRTPLAITRTILENAAADPRTELAPLIERLSAVNTREIALVESLLQLAKTENAVAGHDPVDLALCAEDAVETLAPLAASRGIRIDTALDDAVTTGTAPLLLQVAMNLVHNAIAHNSAEAGWVTVGTRQVSDTVELLVENSGPLLDAETVATLTAPFQRGQRTAAHGSGAGLGLAIVASIVRAHHGELVLEPRQEGGLRALVQLPEVEAGSARRRS